MRKNEAPRRPVGCLATQHQPAQPKQRKSFISVCCLSGMFLSHAPLNSRPQFDAELTSEQEVYSLSDFLKIFFVFILHITHHSTAAWDQSVLVWLSPCLFQQDDNRLWWVRKGRGEGEDGCERTDEQTGDIRTAGALWPFSLVLPPQNAKRWRKGLKRLQRVKNRARSRDRDKLTTEEGG